jgi:hypothetical protein
MKKKRKQKKKELRADVQQEAKEGAPAFGCLSSCCCDSHHSFWRLMQIVILLIHTELAVPQ